MGKESVKRVAKRASSLIYHWLPPVLIMGLIFYLSSLSTLPDFDSFDFSMKKGAHFSVYALLYLFLFRAFCLSNSPRKTPSIPFYILPGIVAVLYAISDEIHQSFVPYRTPTVRDVLIDTAGVLAMSLIIGKWSAFWISLFKKPLFYKRKTP
jgi:VanZ family protein